MILPIVVLDADVLFGGTTRSLFIHLDYEDAVRVHWSARILDEMSVALVRSRRMDTSKAMVNKLRMRSALPGAEIPSGLIEPLEPVMRAAVHDPDDAHVAACAYALVVSGFYPGTPAVGLVTRNVDDFNAAALLSFNVRVHLHDSYMLQLWISNRPKMAAAFRAQRGFLPLGHTVERQLERLRHDLMPRTVAAMLADWQDGIVAL